MLILFLIGVVNFEDNHTQRHNDSHHNLPASQFQWRVRHSSEEDSHNNNWKQTARANHHDNWKIGKFDGVGVCNGDENDSWPTFEPMMPGDCYLLWFWQGCLVIDLSQDEGPESYEDELHIGVFKFFHFSCGIVDIMFGDAAWLNDYTDYWSNPVMEYMVYMPMMPIISCATLVLSNSSIQPLKPNDINYNSTTLRHKSDGYKFVWSFSD